MSASYYTQSRITPSVGSAWSSGTSSSTGLFQTSSYSVGTGTSIYAITSSINSLIYNSAELLDVNGINEDSLKLIIGELMVYFQVDNADDIVASMMRTYGVDTKNKKLELKRGWNITSADGSVITVDDTGGFTIDDSNAKVIYRHTTIRDFNKYMCASDILEQFIEFVGGFGVKQSELLSIPIETFINWLIIEASKLDGEEPPDLPLIENLNKPKQYNRCLCCGKFISNRMAAMSKFCSPAHFEQYMQTDGVLV